MRQGDGDAGAALDGGASRASSPAAEEARP